MTQGVEVRISRFRSLTPDILVVSADAAARAPARFRPQEVLLAVEIVSKNSKAMDRLTKPGLYAQAGIPYYWRIETEDRVVVHTHQLKPDVQVDVPTGEFDQVINLNEPWLIQTPVSQITPPFHPDED